MNTFQTGLYEHYKGNIYNVLDVAIHSDTQEEYVMYRSLGRDQVLYVRPLSAFIGAVNHNGTIMQRFTPTLLSGRQDGTAFFEEL